jgi:hypothetical protein
MHSFTCLLRFVNSTLFTFYNQRSLNYNNNDEPTPDDLFGLLGILPPLCETKFGQRFKKCRTIPPTMGMMGMRRDRDRHRNLYQTNTANNEYDIDQELLTAFNLLSSDDKKRLLTAIEHDDGTMVDEIMDGTTTNGDGSISTRHLMLNDGTDPSPDALFGILGILPPLCERKVGKLFKKCQTEPPTMGMMMGKRHERRRTTTNSDEDEMTNELFEMYNTLSSDDKKRLLIAIESDDTEALNMIFNHHSF